MAKMLQDYGASAAAGSRSKIVYETFFGIDELNGRTFHVVGKSLNRIKQCGGGNTRLSQNLQCFGEKKRDW